MTSIRSGDAIVVTGMGALAAGTASVNGLFAAVLRGMSPGEWVALDGLPDPIAASRAPDPDLAGPKLRYARRLDRSAQLALAAASQAVAQAGFGDAVDPHEVSVVIGSSRGPIGRSLATADEMADGLVAPSAAAESTFASISGIVGQTLGFSGPRVTIASACASGATAICLGALQLLGGEADAVLVGGTEAPLISLLVAQLRAARVTGWDADPTATCKPFDVDRNGLMLGEGSGVLVLERESSAAGRGATILARLSGWATGSDGGGGRTGLSAEGEGLTRVVRRALARAELAPDHIGYVNAHGTGTRLNDRVESHALTNVFGEGRVPPLSSTKPITGHCLGATPALEAIIAIEALRSGCLPPTANHVRLDPECDVDVVAGAFRRTTIAAVLSTSLGFWGAQSALIFEPA